MKVLDVDLLHDGLTRNLNRMTRLENEMMTILKSVEELIGLEDALKGKGGQAIRDFYQLSHVPFLQYFLVFKLEFYSVLQQTKDALTTLEPMDPGHIVEGFLESDVEEGLTRSANITSELTDEANAIMRTVSDIVSLPELDDSRVQENVNNARKQRDDTLEALYTFDHTQTNQLVAIESSIQAMNEWVQNIEGLFKQGLTDVNFPSDKWSEIAANSALVMSISAKGQGSGIVAQEGLSCEVPVDTNVESDRAWYEVVGDVLKGIIDGVVNAIVDIFKGLFDLLISLFTDPIGFIGGIVTAIMNPVDTFNAVWGAVETAWNRDVINGDAHSRAEFFSYAIVSIVGLKGIDKLGRTGNVAGTVSKSEKSIPYNAMQTNKLKDLVKTNVYTNMKRKAQDTIDLLKSNFSKEAITKMLQSLKNSEIITKARNVLDPTKIKVASAKLYENVVKGPIAKTQTRLKEKIEQILDAPLPNLSLSPIPLGPPTNKTVREGIEAAKDSMMQIVGKKDGVGKGVKGKGDIGLEVPPAFRQTEFASSYDSRLNQTPSPVNAKVEFDGIRGESLCTLKPPPDPDLKRILNEAGIEGIQYKNGVPDFSPVAKAQVEINYMLGGKSVYGGKARQANFKQSDQKLADQLNNSPELARQFGMESGTIRARDIKKYREVNNFTWHELNDVKTMQLVPTKINSEFGHLGGVGEINAGAFGPGGFANKQSEEIIK